MATLQKITTEYVEVEDRFRFSGENEQGEILSFWLTKRLLSRLLAHLIKTLEKTKSTNAVGTISQQRMNTLFNELEQQSAQQQIPNQTPVVTDNAVETWLVLAVDISKSSDPIQLLFKGATGNSVELNLDEFHLRQWLSIIHKHWLRAEWSSSIWPEWILSVEQSEPQNSKSLFH